MTREYPITYGSLSGHKVSFLSFRDLLRKSLPNLPESVSNDAGDSPEAEAEDEFFEGSAGADVLKLDEGDRVFATAYHHRSVEEVRATSTVSQRIAEGHARNNAEREKTLHELLPSVFWDFEDVFAKKSFDTLPDHREWDHTIELTGNGKSPHRKLYPLSPGRAGRAGQVP